MASADCPSEIGVPEFRMRLAEEHRDSAWKLSPDPVPGMHSVPAVPLLPREYFFLVCLYEIHSSQKRNKIWGEVVLRTLKKPLSTNHVYSKVRLNLKS